jgi:hypothetical protein
MEAPFTLGSCLCGSVRLRARLPSKWVAHCHCTYCRRAHGAAFVTWAGFADEQVTVDDPARLLHWYESSAGAKRGSCSRCGSPMLFTSTRWPGETHIARALLDEQVDKAPAAHVFYDTHVGWLAVKDELPKKPVDA